MSEQIGVTSLYVMGGAYHMALYYVRSDGTRKVVEFGPAGGNGDASAQSREVAQEFGIIGGDTNRESPFGVLRGGERPWVPRDELLDREVLKQGDNLSANWDAIVQTAQRINDGNYKYFPFEQNSNSVVRTAVDAAGLNRPTGIGESFEGELKGHWVPATENAIPLDGPQSHLDKPSNILSANARLDDDGDIDGIDATLLDGRNLILEYDTLDTHPYTEFDVIKGTESCVYWATLRVIRAGSLGWNTITGCLA
jgi:hypothetical protein